MGCYQAKRRTTTDTANKHEIHRNRSERDRLLIIPHSTIIHQLIADPHSALIQSHREKSRKGSKRAFWSNANSHNVLVSYKMLVLLLPCSQPAVEATPFARTPTESQPPPHPIQCCCYYTENFRYIHITDLHTGLLLTPLDTWNSQIVRIVSFSSS